MIRSLGIVRDGHRKTLLVVTTAKKILLHCSWFPKEISNATIEGNSDPAKMKLGDMDKHGLLYLHGLILRILKKKIEGQIFKRSFA